MTWSLYIIQLYKIGDHPLPPSLPPSPSLPPPPLPSPPNCLTISSAFPLNGIFCSCLMPGAMGTCSKKNTLTPYPSPFILTSSHTHTPTFTPPVTHHPHPHSSHPPTPTLTSSHTHTPTFTPTVTTPTLTLSPTHPHPPLFPSTHTSIFSSTSITLFPLHFLQRSFSLMKSPVPPQSVHIDWICCTIPGPMGLWVICMPCPEHFRQRTTEPCFPPVLERGSGWAREWREGRGRGRVLVRLPPCLLHPLSPSRH